MLCVVCCAARCRGQPCASMPRPHPNPTQRIPPNPTHRAGTRSTRCGRCCRGMADPSMAGRRCAACVSSTWTSRCESRATLAAASSCTRDRWPHPREGRGATALEGASFGTVVGPAESGGRGWGNVETTQNFQKLSKAFLSKIFSYTHQPIYLSILSTQKCRVPTFTPSKTC